MSSWSEVEWAFANTSDAARRIARTSQMQILGHSLLERRIGCANTVLMRVHSVGARLRVLRAPI